MGVSVRIAGLLTHPGERVARDGGKMRVGHIGGAAANLDRRSGGDNVADPWPGYLVGGPHPKAGDWHDEQGDYRTNEIAINWNSALVYALAACLETTP